MEEGERRSDRGSTFAQPIDCLRRVADVLSTKTPLASLWPLLAESIIALLDAERIIVVLRDEAGQRIAYDSSNATDRTREGVAAGTLSDEVLERGETVVRSGEGSSSVGAPIRFANAVLGALVLSGVRADLAAIPLLE
jgi:hypothetical protein